MELGFMYMRPGAGQDFLESRPLLQQFIKTCPPFILLQSSLPNMHTADSEYFVTTHYNLTGAKSFIHSFPGYCLNVPTCPVKNFIHYFQHLRLCLMFWIGCYFLCRILSTPVAWKKHKNLHFSAKLCSVVLFGVVNMLFQKLFSTKACLPRFFLAQINFLLTFFFAKLINF